MTRTDDPTDAQGAPPDHRCGYVALAGRPNVGKSTLLNALIGEHLSIVSERAQTTRERVAGIWSGPVAQIIFVDAPGLLEPRYALQEAMRWCADRAISDADLVVLVCDATREDTFPGGPLLKAVGAGTRELLAVLNKCDLVEPTERNRLVDEIEARGPACVAVSALSGEGLESLRRKVIRRLPESPPLFPVEDTATRPVRFFVEEYVRETCTALFREEVPYSIACRVEEFREARDPVYVRATIFVERESQKGIVIGRGGASIRRVGEASRKKIEALLGRRVYLELRVKVLPRWSRRRDRLQHLGFEVPPSGSVD